MRDLYVLEAFTDDGMTVRTGPHTIAEAMTVVEEHLASDRCLIDEFEAIR